MKQNRIANLEFHPNNFNLTQTSVIQSRTLCASCRRRPYMWKIFLGIVAALIILAIVISITIIEGQNKETLILESTTIIAITTTGATATGTIIAETKTTTATTTTTVAREQTGWEQHGVTVAGGHGQGSQLNQLSSPGRILVDEENTIYIIDRVNDRILQWKDQENNGQIITSVNGPESDPEHWSDLHDMILDKQDKSLIIADIGTRKLLRRFNQTSEQFLLTDIACCGIAMDKDRFIYIVECGEPKITRWREGESAAVIVISANNTDDQLFAPALLFVANDQSLYVLDNVLQCVIKWRKGTTQGVVVAGGYGTGSLLTQFWSPQGMIVDDLGQIYVADTGNQRVIRWCEGCAQGEIVVGGNGSGNQTNQLWGPFSLAFDLEKNLYVSDSFNHRIQKFAKRI